MKQRTLPAAHARLIRQLEHGEARGGRLRAAVALKQVDDYRVTEAYIEALRDADLRVVHVACTELAERRGAPTTLALRSALDHPSWEVRLAVCQQLVNLDEVDLLVVRCLERIKASPEAEWHDRRVKKFNQQMETGEMHFLAEYYDRVQFDPFDVILEKARARAQTTQP